MPKLPQRLKILEWGPNESDRGTFTVDGKSAEALRAQIAGEAWAKLVIDFDHQSEEKSGSYKESPRHHAGYGDLEVVEGDGVYLAGIEWTEAGKEYALDYKDVSPSVEIDKEGRIVGVTSVALVPNGALKGRSLFAARKDLEASRKENAMDPNEEKKEKQEPAPAAGEPTAAPETKPEETAGEPTATPAEDGTPPEEKKEDQAAETAALEAKVTALESALDEVNAKLDALAKAAEKAPDTKGAEEQLAALEKRMLVRFAVSEGKAVTLPESVLRKMTVEETVQHLAGLRPGTLPIQSVIPRGAGAGGPSEPSQRAQGLALVAKHQAEGMGFERAWCTARAERPELFR